MSDPVKTPEVKPEGESGPLDGSRPVANAKRMKRIGVAQSISFLVFFVSLPLSR